MNISRYISSILLILCILPLPSCQRETPAERKAALIKQVNDLVRIPLRSLGENRSSVQSKLGAPSSINSEQFTNLHNPKQTDQIHTLTYSGLTIRIYDVPSLKKEMLLSVRLTENRQGLLPELIGQSEKAIKARFGDPRNVNGTVFLYEPEYTIEDPGNDVVKLEFNNSIVTAVEWDYYVD